MDVIYLDFSKAFDKVDHGVVLRKLSKLKVGDKVGRWIHSFLTNRTQSVCIDGVTANPAPVRSGVPQGSVLGPIIFLILIGDIDENVASSFCSSFADDTRVGRPVNSASDSDLLQKDLDSIYEWAERDNMSFNEDKFETIHYSASKKSESNSTYYTSSGQTIQSKKQVKDLGVLIDDDGLFRGQIRNVISKAKRLSSWILRTFETRAVRPMITLWRTLVLPVLDYCCQIWSPWLKGLINDLESVQRSFTRRIHGLGHMDYWQRLKHLRLYSLERRRERYMIIYAWKIIENLVPGQLKVYTSGRRGRFIHIEDYRNLPNKHV